MIERTRFAPSPTGSLHVGGARTALYCWLYARHGGGRFVLRIEDTDRARSTEASTQGILADMRWLGLAWDDGPNTIDEDGIGPFFQSERLARYDEVLQQLLDQDLAYEAWDSREELDQARLLAASRKEAFRYRRRRVSEAEVAAYRAEGRVPVLRLEVPRVARTVPDHILGDVTVSAADVDDLVIRKADGFPTYHFAVVVDDHDMRVTMVLRGQEHLMNTAKHMAILTALGWEAPSYGHFPLIFNTAGGKMSKRDKAKAARAAARDAHKARGEKELVWLAAAAGLPLDGVVRFMKKKHDEVPTAEAIARALGVTLPPIEVRDFRALGIVPEALLNYLALLGWSPGDDRELLSLDELAAAFDLRGVNKSPARFDLDKLRAINGEYLRRLPRARVQEHLSAWLAVHGGPLSTLSPERMSPVLDLFLVRARTFVDLALQTTFLFEDPTRYDAKAVAKHLVKGGGAARLPAIGDALAAVAEWDVASVEGALGALATALDVGLGKIAQPIRVALTGAAASPSIYDCLVLVGRDATLRRLRACAAAVEAGS